MGFSYLENKYWNNITREERYFCAHLYFNIKNNAASFIEWLKNTKGLNINTELEWEAAYEVCFYRDLRHYKKIYNDDNFYSDKRTFDLCLFSEEIIIVIEAKVQQAFKNDQIYSIKKDKIHLANITNKRIILISLASSIYYNNLANFGNPEILDIFDLKISWSEIAELYNNDIFKKANLIYKS